MNKKIRTYCFILALIYVFVVVYTVVTEIASFKAGFSTEWKDVPREIIHVTLIPKNGSYSFPDKIGVISGTNDVRLEINNAKLLILNPVKLPVGVVILYYITLAVAIIVLISIFCLPFLFFKIMRATSKGDFLNLKVVGRIKKIGGILIFMYVADLFVLLIDYIKARYLVDLANYNCFVDISGSGVLILGVVTLLLAEILRMTINMKEEQDLTI